MSDWPTSNAESAVFATRSASGAARRAPSAIADAAAEAVRLPLNSWGATTIFMTLRNHDRRAQHSRATRLLAAFMGKIAHYTP